MSSWANIQRQSQLYHNRQDFNQQMVDMQPAIAMQQQQVRQAQSIIRDHIRNNSGDNQQEPVLNYQNILQGKYVLIVQINQLEEKIKEYFLDQYLCPLKLKAQRQHQRMNQHQRNKYQTKEIYIGRQQPHNKNFICISNQMVSRRHCVISMIESNLYPRLSKSFLTFLWCRQKIQQWRILSKLPNNAIKIIFQFSMNIHGYYLQDLGSRNGTFIQIKQWNVLKINQIYTLAGQKYQLKIDNILTNHNGWDPLYKQKVTQFFLLLDTSKVTFFPRLPDNIIRYQLSYLCISIKLQNVITDYILTSQTSLIKLGLGQDINLNDPAVPYGDLQAQIQYYQGRWEIKDGGIAPSTYGTWHKLQIKQKQPKEIVKLSNNQIIKLGSVVTLDFSYKI